MSATIVLVIAIVIVIFLIIGLVCLNNYFSKGSRAERLVSSKLRRIAKKNKCSVMNNVYLPLYDGSCEIDHIVVGKFGVLAVETKGISGTLSGSGKYLTHTIGKEVYQLYNPQMQNKTHIDNITHHLRKKGINAPVYGVVVFTATDITFEKSMGIRPENLESFIKHLPSKSCNVIEITEAINEVKIKSPLRKVRHNSQLKKRVKTKNEKL